MRRLISLVLLCTLFASLQATIPPVFGNEFEDKMMYDPLTRVYLTPQRILWQQGNITNSEILLTASSGQAELTGRNRCFLRNVAETDTAALIFDFGKELHGGLQLVMAGGRREPSLVRIRFGESVGECCSQTINNGEPQIGYSTDDHAKRDIIMEIPRDGSIEIGSTGFRFVRLDLLERNATVTLREVRAILRYRDLEYLGSFRCNDERLNRIWLTGAYTVHLNMQEYIWDGVKRDRCIWLGDMHPEVATVMNVFGANQIIPSTLDRAVEQFPLPSWMNGISSYSMWYLIILHDWYMHAGDSAYICRHGDYVRGLIEQFASLVDEDGTEHIEEKTKGSLKYFLDWPSSPNREGVEAGYRALLVWAMKDAQYLCDDVLCDTGHGRLAADVVTRLNRKVKPDHDLKQAAALMSIAGIADPRTECEQVISVDGARRFSTFYGYYMLEAEAMAGNWQFCLDVLRQYWGAMLDKGATTFWEDFNLDWLPNTGRIDEFTPAGMRDIHGDFGAYCYPGYRHSLCHGWASGPTSWLTEHVLGFEVQKPGCRQLRIAPHLGDLEWAEGSFPTPYGSVQVRHERLPDGSVRTAILQRPDEVECIIATDQ